MKRSFTILPWFVLGVANCLRAAEPPLPKFEAQTIDGRVAIGYGVAIGDVDGRGKPDILLADDLSEGHGLACADFLGLGSDQVEVGWRNPNAQKKVGIRLYVPPDLPGGPWKAHVIDDNTMACEDLKVADLDGDGRPDIVASGRSTHNLVIYWNRTGMKK